PVRRGFTKPYYGTIPLQAQIMTEDEIATLLATDHELEGSVSHYLEQIIDRIFSVRFTPGTANFYLQTRDKNNAFVADIVNEGLGTNQLVTMLAKILYDKNQILCIDEPEIHLHPSIINRFVASLVEISDKVEKQFILSTHSEQFLAALLRQVAEGKLAPEDLCVYYLTKDKNGTTQFERQEVNDLGQIRGGYKSFLDAEMENLASLFQLSEV
ncbi:MAG: AAA family ATPase, partial [Saprospiraceae bacterium]